MGIEVRFLDIQDSNATGTIWRAPTSVTYENVNSGNNTGWNFNPIVYDFFTFFNIPLTTQDSDYRRIPRLKFTNIQDCNATGTTFLAPTSQGNVNNGNNAGIDFNISILP